MATVFLGLQKKIGKIWKRSLTVHSVSNPHPWNIWRIRRWLMSRLVLYDIITTKMQWNGMQKHKSRLAKESKKTCAQTCMSGSKEREPWTKSQAACMMAGWGRRQASMDLSLVMRHVPMSPMTSMTRMFLDANTFQYLAEPLVEGGWSLASVIHHWRFLANTTTPWLRGIRVENSGVHCF